MKKTVYAVLTCLVLLCGVLGWKTGQLSAENEQLREELQAAQVSRQGDAALQEQNLRRSIDLYLNRIWTSLKMPDPNRAILLHDDAVSLETITELELTGTQTYSAYGELGGMLADVSVEALFTRLDAGECSRLADCVEKTYLVAETPDSEAITAALDCLKDCLED